MVRKGHNGNREKEVMEDYTTRGKGKEQKDSFIFLGIPSFSFVG
jgi:hypothetical protein